MIDSELKVIGPNFFDTSVSSLLIDLLKSLKRVISADLACIAMGGEQLQHCTTEVITTDGKAIKKLCYFLKDSPCKKLTKDKVYLFETGAQNIFPNDALIQQYHADGYIATPLYNTDNGIVGLTIALYRHPIINVENVKSLFVLFANLIKSELSRQKNQNRLQLTSAIIENSSDGIMVCNASVDILYVNNAFEMITGYKRDCVLGKHPSILSSGYHDIAFYKKLWKSIHDTDHWAGEIWNRRKDGAIYPEWLIINALRKNHNEITHYVGSFSDITDRKIAEQKIRLQANFDSLTKLANRQLFLDRLKQAIYSAERHQTLFAVFFLDLDMFKEVNDTLGHRVGDQLLVKMADRIRRTIRETDTAARLGGDEFTLIIGDISSPKEAEVVASTLLDAVRLAFNVDEHKLKITTSLGISLYPNDGNTPEQLLERADKAMYYAKEHGKNRFSFFTKEMQQDAEHRMAIRNGLKTSLAAKEFLLVYLPIVQLESGKVCKFECLVRWAHNGKVEMPDTFISIAEEFGLINGIDDQVLDMACKTFNKLCTQGFGEIQITVNRSVHNCPRSTQTTPSWLALLEKHNIPPASFCFEVDERILTADSTIAQILLPQLHQAGIGIALDAFGGGSASFSLRSLQQFPIDTIKIDRQVIEGLDKRGSDYKLVKAAIAMAKASNIATVAVGVETEEQLRIVSRLGCDYVQGYYFCENNKPLVEKQLVSYLKSFRNVHVP